MRKINTYSSHIEKLKKDLLARVKIFPPMNILAKLRPKRISLSALPGSLTIEAALAFPLFFIFFTTILQLITIVHVQQQTAMAIQQSSKSAAVYAYILSQDGSEGSNTTADKLAAEYIGGIVSEAYIKDRVFTVLDNVGFRYEHLYDGISLRKTNILENEPVIDIIADYHFKLFYNLFHIPDIQAIQRARVRAWTGRMFMVGEKSSNQQENNGDWVYITVTGEVYHTNEECTHIRLSVKETSLEKIEDLRNTGGGKYYPCESCSKKNNSNTGIYITDTGNRYHNDEKCSGLKRTVVKTLTSEISNMRACSRCGG